MIFHIAFVLCLLLSILGIRSYITFLGQAKFTFNFLPKKSIRVPVETVMALLCHLSRVFINCRISGVTKGACSFKISENKVLNVST